MKKKITAALLTMVLTCQTLCMNTNITHAVPAVTQTQVESACTYDAGYQNGEWFAFIEGGQWKETLGESAKVVFYNAKTKESKEIKAYENGEKVFDSIEPYMYSRYYRESWSTFSTEFYLVKSGEKEALLCADGTYYEGSLKWYDSIEVAGECVMVTSGETKKVLKKFDGIVKTVFEQLSAEAELEYDYNYYYITDSGKMTAYDEEMNVVNIPVPEGYQLRNSEQYRNYEEYGYAIVYKKIVAETGMPTYELNVIDSEGEFLFEESAHTTWLSDNCIMISDGYIWNGVECCLYKIDRMQIVLDKDKINQDLKEQLNYEGEWNVWFFDYYQLDNIVIKTAGEENQVWMTYCAVDDYNTGYVGKQPIIGGGDNDWDYPAYTNGYHLDEKTGEVYCTKKKETIIQLPIEENYYWKEMYPALEGILLSRCKMDGWDTIDTEYYLLKEDGTLKQCDDFLYFPGATDDSQYNLFALQLDNKWHWYMNDLDNKIKETEDGLSNMNLAFGTGYWQGSDSEGDAYLYDQYGNTILGDDTKYTILGNAGVWRNVFELSGTVYSETMKDGYILVADEAGKYGALGISVKYTMTGDVEVTVESEDAEFVSERMEVGEVAEQDNLKDITAKVESEIRQNAKHIIEMKVYDITFYDTKGEEIQPEGKVKVSMSIPTDWDASKEMKVYHVLDDGNIEDMKAEIVDGKAVFYADSFSQYVLAMVEDGVVIQGDVNGDTKVELADAQVTLKAALKIATLDATQTQAADVNGDGKVELADAQKILKVALKIESF